LILYILLVAMLNVSLGFGVAVYLGRRYNQLLADDEPWESMPFGESASLASVAEPVPGEMQTIDAAETDVADPESADTDRAEPESTQPEPEPTEADADKAEAASPEPPEPEATQTEATNVDEEEASQPPQPETDEAAPETAEPDEVAPEMTETDESAPPTPVATDAESVADTPEADTPEAVTPEAVTPEAVTPEPVTTEPVTTEPVTTEPVTTEPATTGAETAEPLADESAEPEEASEPADQKDSAALAATTLKIDVDQFQDRLTELCDELRSQGEAPEAGEVGTCLDSLSAATDEYLENCKSPQAVLDQLCQEPKLEKVGQQVQQSIQQHNEQAESLNAAVAALDRQGDLAEGCRSIAEKSDELLSSGHQLRDNLDEAAAKVAENDGTANETDPAARTDPQTGLFNRAGLEAYLAQWWEDDPERTRQLGAAMIDADEFAAVNAQLGYKTGNRMLSALGKLLETEIDTGVVARFSGQRFFLLFPDGDARAATNGVEKVRQTIAKTCFLHRNSENRVTVSCASTAAILDDTSASLIARTEMALQEAKRYGRNRTFLHEGEYPAPVVPPQFTLDERRITL